MRGDRKKLYRDAREASELRGDGGQGVVPQVQHLPTEC